MPETPILFEQVELLAADGLGYTLRIGGQELFVGSGVPLRGSAALVIGTVERLLLPRWFVEQHGLSGGRVA